MRNLSVPVIGRIKEGRFLLDMRTFPEEGIEYLATQIRHVMERKHN
jgi:L-seryl-tRNA(Ser) seleniumtransferase